MPLSLVDEAGTRLIEGQPGRPLMSRASDAARVVEACLSADVDAALLYPDNLTGAFFDLSSGEAGAVLQTLRNYHVRLAVVCEPGTVRLSRRFGEALAEERRGPWFGLFETRQAALDWLGSSRGARAAEAEA